MDFCYLQPKMFLNEIAPMGVKIRDDISCRILSN